MRIVRINQKKMPRSTDPYVFDKEDLNGKEALLTADGISSSFDFAVKAFDWNDGVDFRPMIFREDGQSPSIGPAEEGFDLLIDFLAQVIHNQLTWLSCPSP